MSAALQNLKAALIDNASVEEKVEVNQRHLIDKILARYSAEFTVFRELLQNSNDAGATNVQILFQSEIKSRSFWQGGSKHVLTAVTYRNNGRPFSTDDWSRLRKIAEGNPDEQKIGFFGVGFYSLFSICEEPFVTSGSESMAFLWKGDMLYTKRGALPPDSISEWTSFFLAMREPIDLPDTLQFGRFLATSMAFTSNLKRVEVLVDDTPVLVFDKKTADPRPLSFSKKVYNLTSPNSIFTLDSVGVKTIQLDVQVKTDTDREPTYYQTFMRIASASLSVRVATNLIKEMERTTKKKPPSKTAMQIMWSNYDEYESSSVVRGKNNMFDDLLPAPSDQGRIFIGFPTYQTTGCTAQLAAHLIPTVERESIDFVDPTLNTWNQELLSMGGLLARILYEDDMDEIDRLYKAMTLDPQSTAWLLKKAAHTMTGFYFKPSTPSPLVSRILGQYFLNRCVKPLTIVSSVGIRNVTQVRLPDATMAEFIKDVPVVPVSVMEQCADMLKALESKGVLCKLGIHDLFTELANRPLSESEVVAMLKWWIAFTRSHAYSIADVDNIVRSTLVVQPSMEKGKEDTIRPLSVIKYHVPKHLIPGDLPIPESCLPLTISNHFRKPELEDSLGFGWRELPISAWADFVTSSPSFKSDAQFVEKVLAVFSRHYGSLPTKTRDHVITLLKGLKCIPTKSGLQLPDDSYFSKVTLFPDLPFVELHNPKSVSEVFLKALGVREHVELQMVFSRIKTLNWDHMQLIKYLATCTLKPEELDRLRVTPIFPKEQPEGAPPTRDRFRASDLYVPEDKFRTFGLPVLEWKTKWKSHTPEAKVLKDLGIRTFISVDELVNLTAAATPPARKEMLAYFVEHYKTVYAPLYMARNIKTPFLPTTGGETLLAAPGDCYADPEAAVMGFPILHPEWRADKDKFGVRDHPTPFILLDRLLRTPPTPATAPAVFGYLATRISEFSRQDWALVASKKIVPISGPPPTWVEPRSVYFGSQDTSLYKSHFTYVDFGVPANTFLRACGTRDEPTPLELTRSLVATPASYLDSLGHEKYLDLIRSVATNFATLKTDLPLLKDMKTVPWLIGVGSHTPASSDPGKESTQFVKLARASDIYLIDDITVNQLFQPLGAPPDELLESLYHALGSQWLTSAVQTEERPRGNQSTTRESQALQKLIHERALLLLYDGQAIRTGKDVVLPNAEKILQELNVVQVPEIQVVRTFLKRSKTELTTACLKYDTRAKTYWLFVVKEFDTFDIARAIGQVILRNCRLKDSLLLSTLLSTSVQNLQRKGFPVDRILKLSDGKLKHAQIVKEQKMQVQRKEEEEEQKRVLQEQLRGEQDGHREPASASSLDTLNSTTSLPPPLPPKQFSTTPPPEHLEAVAQLAHMFPDADKDYLARAVAAAHASGKSAHDVAEKMLDMPYPKAPATTKHATETGAGSSNNPADTDGLLGFLGKARDHISKKGLSALVEFAQQAITPQPMTHPTSGSPHSMTHSTSASPHPSPIRRGGTDGPSGGGDPTPATIATLQHHLSSSIQSLQSTRESSFLASAPPPEPPIGTPDPPTPIAERCTAPAASDLVLRTTVSGTPVYMDRAIPPTHVRTLLQDHALDLNNFVAVLHTLARVFQAPPHTVHVYWDRDGGTIAFNRGKVLFFNCRFYIGLHAQLRRRAAAAATTKAEPPSRQETVPGAWTAPADNTRTTGSSSGAVTTTATMCDHPDAYYYWFLTFCHELAHNFVSAHDAMHGYWTSSFAEMYLGSLVREMRRLGVEM
ncbi:hypothetical protein PhCBS80983_g04477 [Powellomyces hirtus]|uniref:Sacsin/Nov domain-containing protein n=1 Tax=Powellomyces hirtus TaxID=109895 RepID=A0A507DXL1_9FUNG|nr:hypothetical protein PhCBS80983_g04477 [Powellomyces hirtus]